MHSLWIKYKKRNSCMLTISRRTCPGVSNNARYFCPSRFFFLQYWLHYNHFIVELREQSNPLSKKIKMNSIRSFFDFGDFFLMFITSL